MSKWETKIICHRVCETVNVLLVHKASGHYFNIYELKISDYCNVPFLPCGVIVGINHSYKIDVIVFSSFYMIYMYMYVYLKYNYKKYIITYQLFHFNSNGKFASCKIIER